MVSRRSAGSGGFHWGLGTLCGAPETSGVNYSAGVRYREEVALMHPRNESSPRPAGSPPVRHVAASGLRSSVKWPLVGTPPFLALCHGNGSPRRTSSLGSGRMARPSGCPQHRSRYPNSGSSGFGPNFSRRGACASGQIGPCGGNYEARGRQDGVRGWTELYVRANLSWASSSDIVLRPSDMVKTKSWNPRPT